MLIDQKKLDRINELARKAKTSLLTVEEAEEQALLRAEYLAAFRAGFEQQLQQISIVEEDGSITPVVRRSGNTEK